MKRTLLAIALFAAIPASADEADLEKAQRTVAGMRILANTVESYATDQNEYPNVAFDDLEQLVTPIYIAEIPRLDAWGNPFYYLGEPDGQRYRFVSGGADGAIEPESKNLERFEPRMTDDANADLIFQDGVFLQYLAGSK
jgi:Type II secretion system (T2SS), protein G